MLVTFHFTLVGSVKSQRYGFLGIKTGLSHSRCEGLRTSGLLNTPVRLRSLKATPFCVFHSFNPRG